MSKTTNILILLVLAVALVAGLVIVFQPQTKPIEQTGAVLDYSPYSLKLSDFNCQDGCKNATVVANGEQLINNCPTCSEVLVWANMDGEGKNIIIAGYEVTNGLQRSLETQSLPLSSQPNWQQKTYTVATGGGALNITLQEGEWNLVKNISCDKNCPNMWVGTYGKVFFNTCSPLPCRTLDITHSGYDDDYSVRIEQQSGVFAADNSPLSLYEKTFSLKAQPSPSVINFNETVANRQISFTLSPVKP